ncbi:MAG: tetratricopeptide repeat protein [Pirellulaceae bacterium]
MNKPTQVSLVMFACAILWTAFTTTSICALQALSPSSNRPLGNLNADQEDTTLREFESTSLEPSSTLLAGMNQMIPFEVMGSELEEPLRGVARKLLTGSVDEVVSDLEQLRESRKDLPPAPVLIAGMLFTARNADQGRQWLEKTAAEFPDHPTAFNGFARLAITDKRIADAEAMLEKVDRIVQAGNWTEEEAKLFRMEYLNGLTDVAIARQELDKASQYLDELRVLSPENDRVLVRLAQVEFDLGNTDASINHLNDARQRNEEIRVPEVIVAEWYLRMKDHEASEKWIVAAAEAYPANASVQLDYGRWLLQHEQLPQALEAIAKSEEHGANSYIVNYLRGQVAFARRSYELAAMHFQEILSERPSDADATNMLALSLIESNDDSSKSRALELAVMNQRMYPRSPTAMATMGWIYYRTGKQVEAEAAFQQVIATQNIDPAAGYFVSSYLEQRGDYQAAKQLLEAAIAHREYFMFRNAARDLLKKVDAELATAGAGQDEGQTETDASKTGDDSQSDNDQ